MFYTIFWYEFIQTFPNSLLQVNRLLHLTSSKSNFQKYYLKLMPCTEMVLHQTCRWKTGTAERTWRLLAIASVCESERVIHTMGSLDVALTSLSCSLLLIINWKCFLGWLKSLSRLFQLNLQNHLLLPTEYAGVSFKVQVKACSHCGPLEWVCQPRHHSSFFNFFSDHSQPLLPFMSLWIFPVDSTEVRNVSRELLSDCFVSLL